MNLLVEELIDSVVSAFCEVGSEGFFVFDAIEIEVASGELDVPAGLGCGIHLVMAAQLDGTHRTTMFECSICLPLNTRFGPSKISGNI